MVENSPSPTVHIHFQGKDEHEHFQFYFRQHWIRLIKPLCITIFWSALILGTGYMIFSTIEMKDSQTRHGIILGFYSLFVIVHWNFLVRFYTYFLYIVVITDRRVHRIKKTLFSIDDHQTIDIWQLQDIHKWQHGLIQNLFGFGSLILESQNTVLRIHFVPRIGKIYDRISHIREFARIKINAMKEQEKISDV